jgi:hypothetical protein
VQGVVHKEPENIVLGKVVVHKVVDQVDLDKVVDQVDLE